MSIDITSYKLACVIARFLDEKIAKDISILNISNVSSFADYFVMYFLYLTKLFVYFF